MPIVDIRQFTRLPQKKKPSFRALVAIVLLVLGLGGVLVVNHVRNQLPAEHAQAVADDASTFGEVNDGARKKLRRFTPEEFHELATSVKYPNTQLFDTLPSITGDKAADERIRSIAEARGYAMTSMPVGSIHKIHEPRLEDDDLLQPLAAVSWLSLKEAAQRHGLSLSLTSAYRSPEYQRNLFMSHLGAHGVVVAQIASGSADAAIKAVLSQVAIPGYSRHHTGYAIDLWCEDGSTAFLSSSCFQWISADNYRVAKEHGWIPSYPEGVDLQGPEPEPWEYVWVGEILLYE